MEKQYKLIKAYPGSPSILSIAKYIESTKYYYVNGEGSFAKKNVENHPEFWEEIIDCWCVNASQGYSLFKSNKNNLIGIIGDYLKLFESKEAAEKWIDENKPTFSKKQINDALNDLDNSFMENRIKFFKEKLGL